MVTNKSIEWFENVDKISELSREDALNNLVNKRRFLKRKIYTLKGKTAAAIYGESQVGKSYLVSSLLTTEGKPFCLMANDQSYNFIKDINPHGDGSESTSLVTRFSTSYKSTNEDFPIKAELLTPIDIITVLCDCFYSDVKLSHELRLSSLHINEKLKQIKSEYPLETICHSTIDGDDVLNLKDYFSNYLSKADNILSSNFFEIISKLIQRIDFSRWGEVFSLLWNENKVLTNLFNQLINIHSQLSFSENIYLPIDAVLNEKGTILDVKRIKEMYSDFDGVESKYESKTDVLIIDNNGEKHLNFEKSFLCTLISEIIVSLPEEIIKSKPFLKHIDLLDFPGARSRMTHPEELIEQKTIHDLLLRGKVAYLFNKYSDFEKINLLLFCAKHTDPVQRNMPEMLNSWVHKVVGETVEQRERFIQSAKIPPLFIIGTWFNVNLEYDPIKDSKANDDSLNYRWDQRFVRSLSKELLKTDTYNWFTKWTSSNPNFQNLYLLRDFEKSESKSSIFKGYDEFKIEKEEVKPKNYPDFREKLRKSFLNFPFVKQHFEDAAIAWDSAATINKDGTIRIINKLNTAAENINLARSNKITDELNRNLKSVFGVLEQNYHDSDISALLKKAKQKAGNIQLNLDSAFGKDPYFFGSLMLKLMLTQSGIYELFITKVQQLENKNQADLDRYSAIRINVPELNPNNDFDTNLEFLRVQYGKSSLEECREDFEADDINLDELFYGNQDRVSMLSQILAEEVSDFWFNKLSAENDDTISEILKPAVFYDLCSMLKSLYDKLDITSIIKDKIKPYVDNTREVSYDMVADICTSVINRFVKSIGYEFYTHENIESLKTDNEALNLGLKFEDNAVNKTKTKEEAAVLISNMARIDELLNKNPLPKEDIMYLPNYANYIKWYNFLKIGFMNGLDKPNFDIEANERLGVIKNEVAELNY